MPRPLDDWPWQPSPRQPRPTPAGDLEGAVKFGLAVSPEELADLTAMICSGIPPEVDCKATWAPEGGDEFTISVDTPTVKYIQAFIRTDTGLAVDQGVFVLPGDYQKRGFATRLMRNLVLVYDRLGIRHVSVVANHAVGGYTWAKLGAQPLDPELQRGFLLEKLETVAKALEMTEVQLKDAKRVLATAQPHELMHKAASFGAVRGTSVGKALLVGAYWEGYWDLHEPWLRNLLRESIR